jgi:L-methionine (R)-S-oxide reductase
MNSPLPDTLQHTLRESPMEAALAAVITHFDCQAGTYHRAEGDMLHLVTSHHIPPPVVALVQQVPVGKGIAGLAAQRLAPVTLCNLQTDTSGQARPAAKNTGMEGSLAVPALRPDGSLGGVLGIAKATAHDWTDAETAAVTEAARLLAARSA